MMKKARTRSCGLPVPRMSKGRTASLKIRYNSSTTKRTSKSILTTIETTTRITKAMMISRWRMWTPMRTSHQFSLVISKIRTMMISRSQRIDHKINWSCSL